MKIIDRYIARAVLLPTMLTLAVLLVLNSTYVFIDEQGNVGEGRYGMVDAVRYVIFSVPRQIFELMPAAVLIGAMLGLGELARHSEIVAARAAGMSVWRLSLTLILIGLGLAGATAAIGEYIAPQSTLIAQIERAAARTLQEGAMQGSTVWLRDGSRYLRVESIATQPTARTLTTFEVADDHAELVSIGHAEAVAISASDAWTLQDYRRIWYSNEGVRATTDAEHLLHVRAGGALLDAAIDPADRSMRDLARLIREFERNRQDARRLVFARSSRAAHAASATWCVLLALPFGFGSLRSARAGVRLFIAIGIGIAFVLGQQVVQSGVVLTSLPPTLLAWLPTSTLALVTSLLVRRLA